MYIFIDIPFLSPSEMNYTFPNQIQQKCSSSHLEPALRATF